MSRKPGKKPLSLKLLRIVLLGPLIAILLACCALLWLNLFGLPSFIQQKIALTLRDQGVTFQARKVKLDGFSRLLLSDSRISGNEPTSPEVTAPEVEIHAALPNLLRGIVDLQHVEIRNGSMSLPSPGTGARELIMENAHAVISLNQFGHLKVSKASGTLFGIAVETAGTVFHARDALTVAKTPSEPPKWNWRKTIESVHASLARIQSPEAPVLQLKFRADLRRPDILQADLEFHAGDATSPWGQLRDAAVVFQVRPSTNESALVTSGTVRVRDLASTWATVNFGEYSVSMTWPLSTNTGFIGEGRLTLTNLVTPWALLPQIQMSYLSRQPSESGRFETRIDGLAQDFEFASTKIGQGGLTLTLLHEDPLRLGLGFGELAFATNVLGEWQLGLTNLAHPEFTAAQLQATGTLSNAPADLDIRGWGPWKVIAPWSANFTADFINLESNEVLLGNLKSSGSWNAPNLVLDEARALLYGGEASFNGTLDISKQALHSSFRTQFDYQKIAPILDPPVRRWLARFSWHTPPLVEGKMYFQLPPWTNSWENARNLLLNSIQLDGHVSAQGSFRQIPFDRIESDFKFANYTWRLPNLQLYRPEGHASADYSANDRTDDFSVYFNSHIDPHAILPILDPDQQKALKMVAFPTPPEIEGRLTGNWRKDDQLAFEGKVRAQNFLVKKEPFLDLEAQIFYTNLIVEVKDVLGHRVPGEEVRAPALRLDLTNEVMHVRDVISTMNPYIAMKLVGPVVYKAIEPYQFATPPLVRVNGVVPLSEPPDAADLHFEVTGRDFTFWRFHSPELSGQIHWKDDDLWITNVHAAFYKGELLWNGHFYFNDDDTADFSFQSNLRSADATLLLADVAQGKSKMEGTVDGMLHITSANSDDFKIWNGYGHATLRDGFLWDIPVFAMFTPMLEAIAPGLGVSRVTSGSVSFRITNSVIHTKDLQVRAPAFRLRYEGQVDFDGNLNARMEALLLRDTWLLGKAISATLWPLSKVFEANITGTLEQPKSNLRHFPAFITAPFKPVFTIRDLLRNSRQEQQPKPEKPPP